MRKKIYLCLLVLLSQPVWARGADKFTTIYSSRVMSQSLAWIAQDAGLFKKYNIDHNLVFIASSSIVTAALLGSDPDMTLTGGVGNVTAYVRGSTEPVFVGGVKNTMTNSLRELRRAVNELGFIGVAFPPGAMNKSMADEYFYPIFATAQELNIPILCHAGSLKIPGVERFNYQYLPTHTLSHPYEQMVGLMCTMYGGLPDEFPKLRFAYVEAGAGWLPFWIERITEHYEHRGREVPRMRRAPRDYLRSGQIFVACEPAESTLDCVVQLCGEDVLLYASDYPHWDSTFDSVNAIRSRTGLSESAREKILSGNAQRLFESIFQTGLPERCNV